MDTFSGMAVFAKVVEKEGFSAAAQALGLSKSAVSKQVARLEDRLGARLLNRTTRRLSLTEVGAAFYERAVRILAEAEEAEQAVSHLHAEPRGVLKVSAPMSFGVCHLAPALGDFLTRHGELKVEMNLSDRFVDLVDEGFDMAVRIAKLTDSSLIARRLAPCRRVVCAAPAYWRRKGVPAHPSELRNHDCLHYAYQATHDEWRFRGPDGPIAVRVAGRLTVNNGDALREAALAGVGVTFAPTFIVGDDVRAGRLVAALGDFINDELSVYAVYPHNRHLSAKVRAFVDFLVSRFGPNPYWDAA
jgi:DNA-binding transcriptional LysR family regulator